MGKKDKKEKKKKKKKRAAAEAALALEAMPLSDPVPSGKPAYDPASHPQPAVTVDVVLLTIADGELRVLLIRRDLPPFEGEHALPGGFVRIDESLDDAAGRELREETDVEVRFLEQLYTFGDVGRDPARRVVTVAYYALVDAAPLDPHAGTDARTVAWFPIDALPPMAFDHRRIVDYAVERLRYKTEYAPVAFQLLPESFSLTDLQSVYETILARPLDKRNFRRKVHSLEILEPTGDERRDGPGRPAALYRFRTEKFGDLGGGVVLDF
ncbi:MAG: NUDIX domain-containing protein [Sandaracinaceae bacterium]